ncbi:hypothetical protein B9G55_00750 [Saccharibacillus sp. O16]|nr:hypothetical protein B9G55_00750 [Saccharibacillus sp. O16]
MKREEALEYMNRYLDHDLNEEETETLFRHLGESPDAQADFDFLQGLSDQLESLPDVKPPVSLVDSILPRLDEIDRATPLTRQESEQPVVMLPGKQTPPRRKAAAFWRSTLGRAVGGTAVAAAVLGIFVATYKPQEMPNAEVTSSSAVSNATDDTLVSDGAASKKAPDLTDPSTEVKELQPKGGSVPEDNSTQPQESTESQKTNSGEIQGQKIEDQASSQDEGQSSSTAVPASPNSSAGGTVESNPGSDNTRSSDSSSTADQAKPDNQESKKATHDNDNSASDSSTSKQDGTRSEKTPTNDPKSNTKTPPKTNKNAAPPAQAPTPPSSNTPTDTEMSKSNEGIHSFSVSDQAGAEDTKAGSTESGKVESKDQAADEDAQLDADSRGYSLMAAPTEWTSPDQTYLVTYSPGMLTLFKGDRSQELSTLKIEGEATNGVWSEDGKTFTYDLVKSDGTTVSQIWKIEETTLKSGK